MIVAAVLLGTILGVLIASVIALAMIGHQRSAQLTARLDSESRITASLAERVIALEKRKTATEEQPHEEAKKPNLSQQWGARRRVLEQQAETA